MENPPVSSISFVIRLFVEDVGSCGERRWRGTIQHVPSGDQVSVKTLAGVTEFIEVYLRRLGIGLSGGVDDRDARDRGLET